MGQSLFEGGLLLLTFNTILVLLGVCCVGLLVGFLRRPAGRFFLARAALGPLGHAGVRGESAVA